MENAKKQELWRALKFVLFSISAGVIQIVTDLIFNEVCGFRGLGLAWLSYLLSLILSVIWNFTFNRKFTFKSATNVPIAMLKVAAYYAVFTPLSVGWTYLFTKSLFPDNALVVYVVQVLTMLINMGTEFLVQRFWVFGKSLDTAVQTDKNDEDENIYTKETTEFDD